MAKVTTETTVEINSAFIHSKKENKVSLSTLMNKA